jgi:hypothetical protein
MQKVTAAIQQHPGIILNPAIKSHIDEQLGLNKAQTGHSARPSQNGISKQTMEGFAKN